MPSPSTISPGEKTSAPSPRPSAPAGDEHAAKVAGIAARVKAKAAAGVPAHIHKGGVHHVVPLPSDRRFVTEPIDVSDLHHVLAIDREARTCACEPGVTFAELARATLAVGLLPMVVPELEGITVGGAVAGCSVESMSYRYGGFHDAALEYEIVTGTGEVITCSPERDADIFDRVHGSYGTLGILTRATFRLVPAQPYVRTVYHRYADFASFAAAMQAAYAAGEADFIDAIAHAPDALVLCLGHFSATAPFTSDYRGAAIFYKSTLERQKDYLTTFDYCFRYDTECHWLSRTLPPLEWPLVRRVVGPWLLGSTNLIRWSGRVAPLLRLKRRPDVVCDVFIPERRFPDFWEWYVRDFNFFPLWIIPYRVPRMYPWLNPHHAARMGGPMFIDCAVYGKPNNRSEIDYSVLLEEKTFALDGIKTLISRNHYSEERFWEIYDRPGYEAAKQRLDPRGVFAGLYEKLGRVD